MDLQIKHSVVKRTSQILFVHIKMKSKKLNTMAKSSIVKDKSRMRVEKSRSFLFTFEF